MKRNILHSIVPAALGCLVLFGKLDASPGGIQGGQHPAGPDLDSAYRSRLHAATLYSILDLQFGRTDSLLEVFRTAFPDAPALPYVRNYRQFLDVLITGDGRSFASYLEASGLRIETLRAGSRDDPASFPYLSAIYLQSSVLSAYHGEYLRSARHYYHAWHYLRLGEERNAGNPLNYRNRGLITLIGAALPEEYGWILRVIGIRGEMREGFGYLREYYAATSGARQLEALLLLKYARQTLDPGAILSSDEIPDPASPEAGDDPPANHAATLLMYVDALEDLRSGRSRALAERMRNYRQAEGERGLPYLDLVQGEAMLNLLEPTACVPLERFIACHQGKHYRHYAWHKLSWCHLLRGDTAHYANARQQVLQCGEAYLDADRQALSEAGDTLPVNLVLLQSRLLFDAGEYRRALAVLGAQDTGAFPSVPLLNLRDSTECLYRLARILDRMGKTDRAILTYRQVIDAARGSDAYYAPNAALHLGMIHESSGNAGTAMEYYRECLKINRSPYKKSIDYKARQGIRRIEGIQELR